MSTTDTAPVTNASAAATRTLLSADRRSVVISAVLLILLIAAGALTINGFSSANNISSMLLLASFLGIACIGQTLVALLGGLDLSIPFVIGSANLATLWLIGKGLPAPLAILVIVILGIAVGVLNGVLSIRIQGQSLIITLAVGFALVGFTQIVTNFGGGTVSGRAPDWLAGFSSLNGTIFGLRLPPVVLLWAVLAAVAMLAIKWTTFGRALYAVGGNRRAAGYALLSERRAWIGVHAISGFTAALTGIVLLGFTGGGFVGVGDPYLFLTVAAVVVGGTSLLGGNGGYGRTILGALVLTVLASLLIGYGLSTAAQQTVLGLLIVPMVALYARSPHPKTRV
ncbi:ABC transporter permease [Nakamurella sp. GG22]